jgi:hypothetical protein
MESQASHNGSRRPRPRKVLGGSSGPDSGKEVGWLEGGEDVSLRGLMTFVFGEDIFTRLSKRQGRRSRSKQQLETYMKPFRNMLLDVTAWRNLI